MNSRSQRRNRFAKELKPILFLYCVLQQNIWILSSFIFSIFIHIRKQTELAKIEQNSCSYKIRVTFFGTRIHLHLSTISHSALLQHPNLLSSKGLQDDRDADSDNQNNTHVPTHPM